MDLPRLVPSVDISPRIWKSSWAIRPQHREQSALIDSLCLSWPLDGWLRTARPASVVPWLTAAWQSCRPPCLPTVGSWRGMLRQTALVGEIPGCLSLPWPSRHLRLVLPTREARFGSGSTVIFPFLKRIPETPKHVPDAQNKFDMLQRLDSAVREQCDTCSGSPHHQALPLTEHTRPCSLRCRQPTKIGHTLRFLTTRH